MPLCECDRLVLRVVASGGEAVRRTAVVAFELGVSPAVALEVLTRLESRGLVERWTPRLNPGLELWTLSPLSAELLHVHLVEHGLDELWRWDDADRAEPPSRCGRDPSLDGHPPRPDLISVLGLEAPVPRRQRRKDRPC